MTTLEVLSRVSDVEIMHKLSDSIYVVDEWLVDLVVEAVEEWVDVWLVVDVVDE